MKNKAPKIKFNFRTNAILYEKIKEVATKENKSINKQIEYMVKWYLENEYYKDKEMNEEEEK